MIIYILNYLLASIVERKSYGRVSQKAADLVRLVDLSFFHRLNYVEMYVLTKRLHWLTSEYREDRRAFFSALRPMIYTIADEKLLADESIVLSNYSQAYSLMDSGAKDPQELSSKRQYLDRYLAIRSRLTVSTVELAVSNFNKFVLLSRLYKASDPGQDAPISSFKAQENRLLASKVHKREDGTFFMVNLFMHVNMAVSLC